MFDVHAPAGRKGDAAGIRHAWLIVAVLSLAGCAPPSSPISSAEPAVAPTPSTTANADFKPATNAIPKPQWELDDASVELRLARDLQYLASDQLGGRGPFSEGLEQAADYIASQYRAADLDTRLVAGTPFQVFRTQAKWRLAPGSSLDWRLSHGGKSDRVGVDTTDFAPLSLSAPGSFDAPIAFVGFGVTAPEASYDDYQGLDVAGRIVVMLRHTPAALDNRDDPSPKPLSKHALLTCKAENAFAHGARGVIVITDTAHLPRADDPLLGFQVDGKLAAPAGPVLHCRRAVIDRVLAACKRPTLEQLEREIQSSGETRSFLLDDVRASGDVTIERQVRSLRNVIGAIPGRGPLAEQIVIVGAHYDHLGLGGSGSLAPWTRAPHNGADDNASGTTALLEIARQASLRRGDACRRILFVAFSAEEMGLIGSERFVGNPPVPLTDVVAMINLDMVGRLRNDRLIVSGTGTARDFPQLLNRLSSPYQFQLKLDPSGYGPSDHATFHGRGIPVLHFFTGLHEDYHRPSDDFERINLAGLRRIAGLATDVVMELAQAPQRPEPTRSTDDDLLAELGLGTGSTPSTGTSRTRAKTSRRGLGITVQLDDDGRLRIERVHDGSVAAAAQLRAGDILLRAGDVPVRSIDQLRGVVGEQLGAGTLQFAVKRGSTELVVEIDPKSAN